MSSNRTLKLYRARLTVLEQLNTLGFETQNYENFSIGTVDIMSSKDQLDMLLTKPDNRKIYVKFFDGTFGKKHLDELTEELFEIENILTSSDTLMIIIDDEPNDTIQTRLKYIWEHDKQHVVVHNINRLQYNLMNHVLVPKCNILTDEETTLFKQKYSVQTNKQLPEISRFDPQSLVMCMRPGDIIRFERKSQSALHYDYYRLCVN